MRDSSLVLPRVLAERAELVPDHVFLEEVGGASLTYRTLDEEIRTWAGAYQRLGIGADDTVVTMLPAGITASCAWLGLARLRAIEVPCNTAYRGRMLQYLISNARATTIVISERFVDRLAEVVDRLDGLRHVVVIGGASPSLATSATVLSGADFLGDARPIVEPASSEPWDLCALLYTSGTTGPSKGVRFPWAQLHAQAIGAIPVEDLDEDDAWYMPYPMHHVTGKTPFCTMVLCNGRIVIRDGFDTTAFWDDIDRYRLTTTALLGPMAQFLWQQAPAEQDARHTLRNVFMAPLVPFVDGFKERFGVRVATAYGSVENSVPIHVRNWATSSATWRSCGRLREGYPGYEARVVDEHDFDVAPGETGELIIRTSEPWTMNDGYFGMPDETAQAWRNGWFHTGDAFTIDDEGNFYFVDRARDCIRRRGENISSFEVETEVMAHPLVAECAAIGVPSDLGEEEVKVVVVPMPEAELDPADLIAFLEPRVARFMVPRYVEVVPDLPKTEATLRIKKYQLRETGVNDRTWDRDAVAGDISR